MPIKFPQYSFQEGRTFTRNSARMFIIIPLMDSMNYLISSFRFYSLDYVVFYELSLNSFLTRLIDPCFFSGILLENMQKRIAIPSDISIDISK